MQSLAQLTSSKLSLLLPEECINKLFEEYTKDRIYDLATYIKTDKIPENGWFVVFEENNWDIPVWGLVGITTNPLSFCAFRFQEHNNVLFRAYWIPISGFNDSIEINGRTPKCKVRLSCLDHGDYWCYYTTVKEIKEKVMITQKNLDLRNAPITYWVPPK